MLRPASGKNLMGNRARVFLMPRFLARPEGWLGRFLLVATALSLCGARAQDRTYDFLISGGRIVDGTGNSWFVGDLGINGDTIAYLGLAGHAAGKITLEAKGLIVAPGFIDTHSHAARNIFDTPEAENKIRDGVTTVMEGPDVRSAVPLAPFLARLSSLHMSINFGTMVGQGSIREKVIGLANRKATPAEIDQMRHLARQAMLDGAFGLSTGLFYVPGAYTPTEEVIELAKVAGAMGGVYTSHIRSESAAVVDSVRECIRIGEEGGLPAQVTHHKAMGRPNWGKTVETLRLIQEARDRGVDVTADVYPYLASSNSLEGLIPRWALEGGRQALLERLAQPQQRSRILASMADSLENDRGAGDPKNAVIAFCPFDASLSGKNLRELTAARSAGHLPNRRRNRRRAPREGQLRRPLSLHVRGRPRSHSPLPLHHDRFRRLDSEVRRSHAPSAQLWDVLPYPGPLRP